MEWIFNNPQGGGYLKTIKLFSLAIFLFGGVISSSVWAFDDARHHFGSNYGGGPYGYGHGRFFLSPYYAYHPRKVEMPIETSSICSAPRHRAISYRITVQLLALLQQPGRLLSTCQKVSRWLVTGCPAANGKLELEGGTPSIGLSHPSSKKYLRLHRL